MKTRTLVRKHGWTAVDVKRMEIDWSSAWHTMLDSQDKSHYHQIKEWCDTVVGRENYVSTLQDGSSRDQVKRFVFKNAKHATMFRLKWLTS